MAPLHIFPRLAQVLRHHRALVMLVWVLGLLLSSVGLLPGLSALSVILNSRPAAAALARGDADVLWAEVFADNPTLMVSLLSAAVAAGLLYWLLITALRGGLLAALRRAQRLPRAALWSEGGRLFSALLRLSLMGVLLRLPAVLLAIAGGAALSASVADHGHGFLRGAALLLAALVALLWCAAGVILHFAQAHLALPPAGTPLRARSSLRAGLRLGLRQPGGRTRTVQLAVLSLVGYGILIMSGHALARPLLHHSSSAATVLAFALRQLFAVGRAALSLTLLGAAAACVAPSPLTNTPGAEAAALPPGDAPAQTW